MIDTMKLYIIGPYRGNVRENVQRVIEATRQLYRAGYHIYCPHLETFGPAELNERCGLEMGHDDERWLPLVSAWIPCCDGAALVGDADSDGCVREIRQFRDLSRPVRNWRAWVAIAEGETDVL